MKDIQKIDDDLFDPIEDEDFSPVARLIELGRKKKYVTIDDIINFSLKQKEMSIS